jgi:hypothetical protein
MSQQKQKKITIAVSVVAVILVVMYFIPLQKETTIIPITQEDEERSGALGVAQRFVTSSPTFAFDGDINTLRTEYVGSTKSIPPQHMFRATFDSSHGGFGNREGQMLTQAITPHTMSIIVSEDVVISAVTDDIWDELNHQYVLKKPDQKLPSHDEPVTPFEGEVNDYSSLVAAIKSRGILVDLTEELEESMFSAPAKVISVGGVDVQIFEFQTESDAKTSSLTVSEDGTEIGTSIIRWIDTPHFYTKGKIIVLYVGQNPEITNLLESILGAQFAGM